MALLAGVLVWLAFRGIDFSLLVHEIRDANLFWLGLSIVLSIVAFFSRAYRWKLLIDPLGHHTPLSKAFYALMVGYLANLAFPRLGEITRCGALSKSGRIPFDQLLGTVILERALDVVCLLTALVITALVEADRLGSFVMEKIVHPIGIKAAALLHSPLLWAAALVVVVLAAWWFRSRREEEGTHTLTGRIRDLVRGVGRGLQSIRTLEKPWAFLFHTLLIWTLYYYMAYACFFALPATSELSWRAALFVLVAGGIGMSVPVQGGIGAYHLLVSQGLVLYGILQQHAMAFATLVHTSQVLLVVVIGGSSLLLLFSVKNKNHDHAGPHPVENP
jgi:uncharacterized protein (TIRG00374 family)